MSQSKYPSESLTSYNRKSDPLNPSPTQRATLALAPDFTLFKHLSDPSAIYLELPRQSGTLIPRRLRVRLPLDLVYTLRAASLERLSTYDLSDEALASHVTEVLLASGQRQPLPPPLAWEYTLTFGPSDDPLELKHVAMLRYLKAQRRRERRALTAFASYWIAETVKLDTENDFSRLPPRSSR